VGDEQNNASHTLSGFCTMHFNSFLPDLLFNIRGQWASRVQEERQQATTFKPP